MNTYLSVAPDVKLGANVRLAKFINLYGCEIGDNTKIGTFVEIQKNAKVGKNCKVSSHSFICEGVAIEDNVFIGHGVTFINDRYPRATTASGELQTEKDWRVGRTLVRKGASVGSGVTILANLTIGENAIIGAGSVVTKSVPSDVIVAGNPARVLRSIPETGTQRSETTNIPFLDLVTLHDELQEELVEVFRSALKRASFVGGPTVEEFEWEFGKYCDTEHCVGVASGTDALRFALMAAGVPEGEIVVTVPNTFIATTEAILQAKAWPDFVDIEERTYNMDPEKLRRYLEAACYVDPGSGKLINRRLNKPVAGVIPVHLYGQPADMDPILELAERYGLVVVEDACQAHGAEYFSTKANRWRKVGSMGHAAAFSFYPGKNLGACGEAGAVTTNDAKMAQKIRMLRDHGQSRKYFHEMEGYNGRLDAIQASILRLKLGYLTSWNEQRREQARIYGELLGPVDGAVIAPHVPDWARPVFHLYVVRIAEREQIQKSLARSGIGTAIHYPVPLHLTEAHAALGFGPGDFPVAERAATEVLSLPIFPGLAADSQLRVAREMLQLLSAKEAGVAR